jgi:hypothetical protein
MDYHDYGDWIDCWQCGGVGMTSGCFEDFCFGATCDPDDAELCCAPNTCAALYFQHRICGWAMGCRALI